MTLLAFFLGLLVLVLISACGRHLFYLFWWGAPPRKMDRDFGDVACGWFVGSLVAWMMILVALLALAVGSLVLSVACGSDEVTLSTQLDT